jgi:hypothetical protein
MRLMTRSAVLGAAGLAALAIGAVPVAQAAQRAPAFFGKETFKIVAITAGGPKRPAATAHGAINAAGTYRRLHATLAFPKGRIKISREVTGTTTIGPDLSTCRFTIRVHGDFSVVKATGRYRGLRETGTFSSVIRGRYNRTGPDRCGARLVRFREVTYEVGVAR